MADFPNGTQSYLETFYEIVSRLERERRRKIITCPVVNHIQLRHGTTGFYSIAQSLTDEFERMNKGRHWDGEFFEEIESYLDKKLWEK
jgi:hypothetical protein